MAITFKQILYNVLKETSKGISLHSAVCFLIQILCNLEMIFMILSGVAMTKFTNTGKITISMNHIISYIGSFSLFDSFASNEGVNASFYTSALYFFCYASIVMYITFKVSRQRSTNPFILRIFAFTRILHSRVLFYVCHNFFMKFISLFGKCDGSEEPMGYCQTAKVIIVSILAVLNIVAAFAQELYCYQIQKTKNSNSIKDNIHPLILLLHKTTVIPLSCFLEESELVAAIFNVVGAFLNLLVLQTRLPFYNLIMLKMSIVFATISCVLSLGFIGELVTTEGMLMFILLLALPLAVKGSLIILNNTLLRVLKLEVNNPIQVVHLPVILKECLKDLSSFPIQKKLSKGTFYLYGFLQKNMSDVLMLEGAEAVKHAKGQVYTAVADRFIELLKIYPKNEFLLLSLARIYIRKLGDAPKAIFILNRMKTTNVSIPMENSLQYLHAELGAMYLKANSKFEEEADYLSYFHYREKAFWMKEQIRKEIAEHLKLWKALSEDPVHAKNIIEYSENINFLSKRIEQFWIANFHTKERAYVNAPIMYGLYVEIIQGLSFAGIPLVQKAYEWLLHKNSIQRDVMDVSIGNSAVVVASIEPERLGQIIDASASVKNLFEIDKEHAIGSNIGIMMPSMIAKKHDRMIQRYHKAFTYDLNRNIKTYGKTVGDEYFGIEITLRVYPSVNKGLNLMAYIKKISKSESLLIVNYEGKIVECSRDLKPNLTERGNFVSLSELCPELAQASEAFSVTHVPKETWMETYTDPQNFFDNDTYAGLSRTKPRESVFSLYKVPFMSSRDLLKSYRDGDESPKTILRSEKNLLSEVYDTGILSPKRTTIKNTEAFPSFPKEEAEAICNTFKDGKRLKFRVTKAGVRQDLLFETQIEPLVFSGELYKIVKLKSVESFSKLMSYIPESVEGKIEPSDRFADTFPLEKEKSDDEEVKEKKPQAKTVKILVNSLDKLERKLTVKKNTPETQLFGDTNEANLSQPYKLKNMSVATRTNSIVTSSKSGKNAAKSLNQLFRDEKISFPTRVSIIMVFFAIAAVILSVCIDYFLTTASLREMEAAIGLIEVVNLRSFRTIFAWQAVLKIYSRSVELEDSNVAFSPYQESLKKLSLEMLSSNLVLEGRVDEFDDDEVTRSFFEKSISLWSPYRDMTLNFDRVDSFTANHIIYDYNVFIANFDGSITDLKNRSEALISINNTANDYLVTVEESISDVERFFNRTKDSSVRILRLIVALENVALIMPFVSLVVLFKIIIDSHKKLFKVVSKIQQRSLTERISQINSLSRYLNENVEDLVVFYHDFKSINPSANNEAKSQTYQNKRYKIAGLVWHMMKYLFFALLLVAVIIALFLTAFSSSMQNFNDLSTINQETVAVYKLGEQVAMILPNFYFLAIFQNDPSFKIRNDLPSNQLLRHIESLNQANGVLVSALSNDDQGITDSFIENLLKVNLCNFVSTVDIPGCKSITNDGSIGLLGLNSKFYQILAIGMQDYLTDPSFAQAQQFFDDLDEELDQIPKLLNAAYETLAQHLLDTFRYQVKDRIDDSLYLFFANLAAILISMFLIRIIIVKRYKELDIAVRKILSVIPINIIEKNKVFRYYLTQEFKNELTNVRGFA